MFFHQCLQWKTWNAQPVVIPPLIPRFRGLHQISHSLASCCQLTVDGHLFPSHTISGSKKWFRQQLCKLMAVPVYGLVRNSKYGTYCAQWIVWAHQCKLGSEQACLHTGELAILGERLGPNYQKRAMCSMALFSTISTVKVQLNNLFIGCSPRGPCICIWDMTCC